MEHDYRTQCLGGRLAELADVVLCDVDQYRVRYVGRLGIGALRISGQRVGKRLGRFAVCAADGGNRHCVGNPVCAQWLDSRFFEPLGIKIAFTPIGIWIALIVVSLPFIVRAVQPVLEELSGEYEEAAATLGASRWTTFRRVLLPEITPALLTGAGMMFARSTGEYGSVIFIAGNIPMVSEILPLIITGKLEQYDAQGASAVALFMLMISFVILLILNIMQWTLSRRAGTRV